MIQWLLLLGIALIAGIIIVSCISFFYINYLKNNESSQLQRNRDDTLRPRESPVLIPQADSALRDLIDWTDIPVVESEDNLWINNSENNLLSWVELEVENESNEVDENFLDLGVPDDLDNILRNVIGSKDIHTLEIFQPGEQVYLCRLHRLAFHEDSWQESDCQCPVCGNSSHTGQYQLPS